MARANQETVTTFGEVLHSLRTFLIHGTGRTRQTIG